MSYHSVFRQELFAGKVILVTGGGSGIGRCVAHELASLGATVFLSGRKREKLEKVLQEIVQDGGKADFEVCDNREESDVQKLVAAILARHNRLDGVVNNAGGQFPRPLEELSKNGWEAVIRNNLTGTFLVCREVVRQVFSKSGGVFVNVLSDFRNGWPKMGHSGAARAGVDNLTKTAAIEWAKYGVRINSVAPGVVESSGLANYPPEFLAKSRENVPRIPAKRFATESEISAAIVFLLTPGAAYVTGALLQVDGGLTLRGHITPLEDYSAHQSYDGFGSQVE